MCCCIPDKRRPRWAGYETLTRQPDGTYWVRLRPAEPHALDPVIVWVWQPEPPAAAGPAESAL
jgi:hypothetical protein